MFHAVVRYSVVLRGFVALALLVVVEPVVAQGAVIHVDASRPAGGAGTSWVDAFDSLTDALALATSEDEVWVAEGVYRPGPSGGPVTSTFAVADGVAVYGGFRGDEFAREDRDPGQFPVILDGDLDGDDPLWADNVDHVVTFDGVGATTVLSGVTVRGGFTRPDAAVPAGGGLLLLDSSPTLDRVHVVENRTAPGTAIAVDAASGAGIAVQGRGQPVLVECEIRANTTGIGFDDLSTGSVSGRGGDGAGLWVRNASVHLDGCWFDGNVCGKGGTGDVPAGGGRGGAIAVVDGFLEMSGTQLLANRSGAGGDAVAGTAAVGGHGGGLFAVDSVLQLRDCEFRENTTGVAGLANIPAASGSGGGLRLERSQAELRRCWIVDNDTGLGSPGARESGGSGDGGGLSVLESQGVELISCRVIGNRTGEVEIGFIAGGSSGDGGGIHAASTSALCVIDTVVVGNRTADGGTADEFMGGDAGSGGGIAAILTGVTIVQSLLGSNTTGNGGSAGLGVGGSGGHGGGMYAWFSPATIVQSTIAMNAAGGAGSGFPTGANGEAGGLRVFDAAATLSNTIVYGNVDAIGDPLAAQYEGAVAFDHCCVEAWSGGSGTSGDDPQFADPLGPDSVAGTEDDDYSLTIGSPLIDAGDNSVLGVDAWDLDEDLSTAEAWPLDLVGASRYVDDSTVVDTGVGAPPVVDIGAIEWPAPCLPPAIGTTFRSIALCPGESLLLQGAVTGSEPLEYQWFLDGLAVLGATEPSLWTPSVSTDDSGEYSLSVSNPCGTVVAAVAQLSISPPSVCAVSFRRGDSDGNGTLDLLDVIRNLQFTLLGEPTDCQDALDVNDDEAIGVDDAIVLASYLFAGGAPPAVPSMTCGVDPSGDALGCENAPTCP